MAHTTWDLYGKQDKGGFPPCPDPWLGQGGPPLYQANQGGKSRQTKQCLRSDNPSPSAEQTSTHPRAHQVQCSSKATPYP